MDATEASVRKACIAKLLADGHTQWRFIDAVLYNPILALIKVSFILTLIKLEAPSVWVKGSLWTLFTVNIMFGIAGTLVALLNCRPIPKFWDRTIPGSCMNTAQYIYGTISVTIITDALASVVSVFILFGFHMPRKTKALVISFHSLGLIVTAIATYRLSVFIKVFGVDSPLKIESPYNVRTPLSNIEASLAAVAVCGPTLKYIVGLIIPSNRSKPRSATPQWDMMNQGPMNNKRDCNFNAGRDPIKHADDSVIELDDALECRITQKTAGVRLQEKIMEVSKRQLPL